MVKNIKFKQLDKTHLNDVRSLEDEIHSSLTDKDFWIKWTDKNYENLFDEYIIWGAFDNEKLIAFISLKDKEHDGVMVHPKYQDKGIATALTNKLIQYVKIMGRDYITTVVHPRNKKSIHILEKTGFKKIRTCKGREGTPRILYQNDISRQECQAD
jgi:RimJ/RimL family protein N-acetyltransferase